MARKQSDGIAVICPNCGWGDKGYAGMRCPDCESEMVPDTGAVDTERAMAGVGKEDTDEDVEKGLTGGDEPNKMDESLEEMANEELEKDEGWGDEHY